MRCAAQAAAGAEHTRAILRVAQLVAPIRFDALSLNPKARPHAKKGKLCSPKDSFPISGASKTVPTRPTKPHSRRLL